IIEIVRRPYHLTVEKLNADYLAEAQKRVAEHPELQPKYFDKNGEFRNVIDERLVALAPTEAMWFGLKVAGYAALVFGSPVLLWQLWQFVAAGLYKRERRWVLYFFPPALILFAIGVLFSYFWIVPYGMYFTMPSPAQMDIIKPGTSLEYYFDFLFGMCVAMGAVFQLPLLMSFLGLVDIVPASTFASMRSYFVIGAFTIAPLLTPGPDVFSQVLMAVPMIVLYELGILGARFAARPPKASEAKTA